MVESMVDWKELKEVAYLDLKMVVALVESSDSNQVEQKVGMKDEMKVDSQAVMMGSKLAQKMVATMATLWVEKMATLKA